MSGLCFTALTMWFVVCVVSLKMPFVEALQDVHPAVFGVLVVGSFVFVAAVISHVVKAVRRARLAVKQANKAAREVIPEMARSCVTPDGMRALFAVAVAALVLIALCLVVIACVLVF